MYHSLIIGVDFDGTIVDHKYPEIGKPVPGAFKYLKKFVKAGARLVLFTMRSDGKTAGDVLTQAVEFCKTNGVEFWGVNENPEQKIWTTSPKAYCHAYIDDAAACCPLLDNKKVDGRPYVDWSVVGPIVLKMIKNYRGHW